MKKLVFTALLSLLFALVSNAQKAELQDWHNMMKTYSEKIDLVLKEECPKDVDFKKFKEGVRTGAYELSKDAVSKVSALTTPIKEYAIQLAEVQKIDISDLSQDELLVMGASIPPLEISGDIMVANGTPAQLTGPEVWDCLTEAVGLGAAGALGTFALDAAGIKILTKAITKFLVKNLGWVGVAITVADFSFCIYEQSQD